VANPPQDRNAPADADLSPDVIEQRQRADGSLVDPSAFDEDADRPLTPDEIDQRRDVVDPDDYDDDDRTD
jgi:hypothetical protein